MFLLLLLQTSNFQLIQIKSLFKIYGNASDDKLICFFLFILYSYHKLVSDLLYIVVYRLNDKYIN